jgi:Ni/Co efflux regulator RcnB
LYGWAAANDANLPVDSGADPEYDKRLAAAVAANKKATDEKQAAEDRKKREERDKAERSHRDRDRDRYDKSDRRDRDIGNGSGGYGSNWRNYGRGKRY